MQKKIIPICAETMETACEKYKIRWKIPSNTYHEKQTPLAGLHPFPNIC